MALAQQNFRLGFIITNNGDTIKAEIDDRNWTFNPDRVNIRNSGKISTYNIDSLQGFGISNGDNYQRFIVEKHMDPDNFRNAIEGLTNDVITDTVWLRQIWKGCYSLWLLEDETRKWFYVESATKEIAELVYRVRLSNGEVQELFEYRQYLRDLGKASGKEDLAETLVLNTKYTQASLITFFENICGSSAGKSKSNSKLRAFVDGGLSIVQATYQNESPNTQGTFAKAIYDNQTQFIPQIGVGFTGDRGMSHWLGLIHVGYRGVNATGNVLPGSQNGSSFGTQYLYKAGYLQTQFAVHYSPITGLAVEPYAGLLAEVNLRLSVNEHTSIVYNGDISNEVFRVASVPNFGNAISQFGAKVGILIKHKFKVEGSYYFPANMLSGTNQQSSSASQSLMLKGFGLSAYAILFGTKSQNN